MKNGGKVKIDLIVEHASYQERQSQWSEAMYSFLRDSCVNKAGTVRIIVRKTGNRYELVAGHYLLKAARECGFKNVHIDIADSAAEQKNYLTHFAKIITDYRRKSGKMEAVPDARARL